MPVRTLKPSYIANTGKYPSEKKGQYAQYESSLERNFIALLDEDPNVVSIDEHPLTIQWVNENGRTVPYTPDMRVLYLNDPQQVIYEVKSREEIRKDFKHLKFKFRTIRQILRTMGYKFRVITEADLTGHYVNNLLFLKTYKKIHLDKDILESLSNCLEAKPTTVSDYLSTYCQGTIQQIDTLPHIWGAVAQGYVFTDLHLRLTNSSLLYPSHKQEEAE